MFGFKTPKTPSMNVKHLTENVIAMLRNSVVTLDLFILINKYYLLG